MAIGAVRNLIANGRRDALIVAAVSALIMAPALLVDRLLAGDAFLHVRWQVSFAPIFWGGDLYPRWLSDFNQGFGSPTFFIYPPLLQWTASLAYPLLPDPTLATTRVLLALVAFLIASGLGTMRWLRAAGLAPLPTLIGGLTYLVLPYHAYFDLYHRGAFGELVGLAVLPWALRWAHGLKRDERLGWLGFTASIAGLFLSNAPTALVNVPFAILYSAWLADRDDWRALFLKAGSSGFVGILISGLYLVTAQSHINFIATPALFGQIHPSNQLIFASQPWSNQNFQLAIEAIFYGHLLIAAIVGAALIHRGRIAPQPRIVLFLGVSFLLTSLLMTQISRPFWDFAPLASRMQFAWRLLGIQCLFLAGLSAVAVQAFDETVWTQFAQRAALVMLGGLILFDAALLIGRTRYGAPAPTRREMAAIPVDAFEYQIGDIGGLTDRFGGRLLIIEKGSARARVFSWQARHIALDVAADEEATIAFHQFVYPQWDYRIGKQSWQSALGSNGVPAIRVPPGRHRVEIRLSRTPPELIGFAVSAFGILLAGGIFLISLRSRKKSSFQAEAGG